MSKVMKPAKETKRRFSPSTILHHLIFLSGSSGAISLLSAVVRMNYTLQLHGEKLVYPVPEGLQELVMDIAREVLRAQPEQIVPFIAEYLSALLITREATKDAIRIVDDALDNDLMKYCLTLKTSPERVLWAVRVIQTALRKYFARKNLRLHKKDLAIKRYQKLGKVAATREEHADAMAGFLQSHNITYLQAHYAAIVLQRAWRGYRARKALRMRKVPQVGKGVSEDVKPELEKYAPSWANSWLTLFERAEPPVTPFSKGKMFPIKTPSNVFLPRREITVNRHVLQTLFSGEKGDYDEVVTSDDLLDDEVGLGMQELEFLSEELSPAECQLLKQAFNLDRSFEGVERDNCLELLMKYNEELSMEGSDVVQSVFRHKLTQVGRPDLADWLSRVNFHKTGISSTSSPSSSDSEDMKITPTYYKWSYLDFAIFTLAAWELFALGWLIIQLIVVNMKATALVSLIST